MAILPLESEYMMSLPLITRFNDGVNDVTKNVGTHGGNAVFGNGAGSYKPEMRYPRGVKFQSLNRNMHIVDSVNNDYNFDGSEDWFVSCMMRTSIPLGSLIQRRTGAGGWVMLISNGLANFFLESGAVGISLLSSTYIADGAFHEVLFAWRASDRTRRVYVDGKLEAVSAPYLHNYSQEGLNMFMGTNQSLTQDFVGDALFHRVGKFEPTDEQIALMYERDLLRLNSKT